MRKPAANIVRISCLVLILAGLAVQPASGYTLVDWIRTWPASAPGTAPAPMAPAVMPIFSSPAPGCGTPVPSYGTPVPNCGTPAPSCDARPPYYTAPATVAPGPNCGAAMPAAPVGAGVTYLQPAPTVAVPVQQVRYRTTWVRTPTTNYRPIVTYDPATGWPTTAMQPCTTYTWQLQRVPTNRQGGWFSNAFGNLFGPPSPPPAQAVGVYVPAPAPVVAPGWFGSPTPVAPAMPAYSAPSSAAPGMPYGSPAPLASPTPSSGWVPSGSSPGLPATPMMPAPPAGTGSPGTPTPADQVPRLSPNEAQGLQNLQPIPETRGFAPANNDASLLAPPPLLSPSKAPAAPPSAPANVSPVPDPDAGAGRSQVPAAPSLYDPNGRTARVLPLSTHWPAAPIRWSEPTLVSENPTVTASGLSKPAETPPAPEADGWQAVRP
jgi:hypothetical protein